MWIEFLSAKKTLQFLIYGMLQISYIHFLFLFTLEDCQGESFPNYNVTASFLGSNDWNNIKDTQKILIYTFLFGKVNWVELTIVLVERTVVINVVNRNWADQTMVNLINEKLIAWQNINKRKNIKTSPSLFFRRRVSVLHWRFCLQNPMTLFISEKIQYMAFLCLHIHLQTR